MIKFLIEQGIICKHHDKKEACWEVVHIAFDGVCSIQCKYCNKIKRKTL